MANGTAATDVLENNLVDYMQGGGASGIADWDYIDTGIGTTTPTVLDTTLDNDAGTPARVQGTMSQPSSFIHRVVGTVSYTSTLAITEVGLFNAVTSGSMAMRSVFSTLNVVNGDSIAFTLDITFVAQVA